MSRPPTGNILFGAVRMLLIAILRIIGIALAWVFKISGITLTKVGEALERVISK